LRKLATTAASAKFDSLQPLRSTGTWSADGEWFAFAAVRQGRAALMLIDLLGLGRDREIVFDQIGQVLSATWSPDGQSMALSALAGGVTDLYLCDLATGRLQQLTDDPFADLQPAWSHDGRSIAFVTERLSSSLSPLSIGRPQLAVVDVATRAVQPIAGDPSAAHLSPQWSADDRKLYFVSDPDGTMNIYRMDLSDPERDRITEVQTGVSGITPTSPAFSVAANESAMAFTVYERGRPRLVVLEQPDALRGSELAGPGPEIVAATNHETGKVDQYLADLDTGLPAITSIKTQPYLPSMSLEGIGQPYLSSGGGPFGTFVRGGGSLLFGDMLGERRLGAAIQLGNRLRDAAFAVRFLNQQQRWNWGLQGELQPSVMRYRHSEAVEHDGQPALLRRSDYFERMQLRAGAFVAYPFSRGLRVEFSGGVRQAMYRLDVRSQIASLSTGKVLQTDQVASTGGEPTTLVEVGAALVHDTTVFGPTGPLLGSRYRFEVTPTTGRLSYTSVAADVRKYFMPVRPYTVAVRLLHSGRYGGDSADPRLMSSFLGSEYLVRGHRKDMNYCRPDAARACGDDLIGHRLAVGNVEIRVPLWGIKSRQLEYAPFPIDLFAFADGGMVWSDLRGPARISSIGGGVRTNVAGFPIELGATRVADGPKPRWQFDFGFRVGF
jgi:hypothetical protein